MGRVECIEWQRSALQISASHSLFSRMGCKFCSPYRGRNPPSNCVGRMERIAAHGSATERSARLVTSQGQRATVGPTGAARQRWESRAWQCRARQRSLLSRSGYGVTRSHKRGGNVTRGTDCNAAQGTAEHGIAKLLLPQPLRTSQGPTVQEVPKGTQRKEVDSSRMQSIVV